jgi:hypothetical protein
VFEQNPSMPAKPQVSSQHMLTIQSHPSTDRNSITTFVDKTPLMPARTQNVCHLVLTMSARTENVSQLELTKPNPHMPTITKNKAQHVLAKHYHASTGTKSIATCGDQTHSIQERSEKVSQHALTKLMPCHRAQKMHINMCWPDPTHISENTKCYQQALTKPLSFQRATEMHITLC